MSSKDKKKPTYQMRSVNPTESGPSVADENPDGYTEQRQSNPGPDVRKLKSRLLRVIP